MIKSATPNAHKYFNNMKKAILSTLALLALLATPTARAWTYSDGDLLLVFRESGHKDIEFDLGSVSNLLGQANGYTTAITGWDTSLVTTEFGTDLTGVSVVLLGTTSRAQQTAWLSSSEPNFSAYQPSQSAWSTSLYGIIDSVGTRPLVPVPITPTESNAYAISPSSKQAYDYLVSGGTSSGANAIPQFGGNAPFTVEQTIPGLLDFWQIQATSSTTPVPDQLVGTFTITTSGVLTFIAGSRPSVITAVSHAGNISSVSFTTTVGNHYALSYTNTLGGPVSIWPVDGTTLVGDGHVDTINRTSTDNSEFYRVNTQ